MTRIGFMGMVTAAAKSWAVFGPMISAESLPPLAILGAGDSLATQRIAERIPWRSWDGHLQNRTAEKVETQSLRLDSEDRTARQAVR